MVKHLNLALVPAGTNRLTPVPRPDLHVGHIMLLLPSCNKTVYQGYTNDMCTVIYKKHTATIECTVIYQDYIPTIEVQLFIKMSCTANDQEYTSTITLTTKVFIKRTPLSPFLYINVRDRLNNWVYSTIYHGYTSFSFSNDKCKRTYKHLFKVKSNQN